MGALWTALSGAGSSVAGGAAAGTAGTVASGITGSATAGTATGAITGSAAGTAAGAATGKAVASTAIGTAMDVGATGVDPFAVGAADVGPLSNSNAMTSGAPGVQAEMAKTSFKAGATELVGEGSGENLWGGISSAFRGLNKDGTYKMSWGESLGSQLGEMMINGSGGGGSAPLPANAKLGAYGGGRGGGNFSASGYLTRGFQSNSPMSYISTFSQR